MARVFMLYGVFKRASKDIQINRFSLTWYWTLSDKPKSIPAFARVYFAIFQIHTIINVIGKV